MAAAAAVRRGRREARGGRRAPTLRWLLKLIIAMASVLAGGARAQEMSGCCSKAEGSCRSVCEKMSLADIAADGAMRDDRLRHIYKFCSPALIDFWICMNETIQEVLAGDEWWGRACCSLPRGAECRRACATGRDARAAAAACRRSDELAFFDCVRRQEEAQLCCSQTQSLSCHAACRELFWRSLRGGGGGMGGGGVGSARSRAAAACATHSPAVARCVHNMTRTAPATDPLKYVECCRVSASASCRASCRRVLGAAGSPPAPAAATTAAATDSHEIIDALLAGGCGAPLPHDAFWQCFLRKDSPDPSAAAAAAALDRLPVDSAKLHCCHKARSAQCRRLCFDTYNRDWVDSWRPFEMECLRGAREPDLADCLLEVEEPCTLGCDGLAYCTNFNNRPTSLFRACAAPADLTAHQDVSAQLSRGGYVTLESLRLPVHNSSRCSPELWRAVACVLQVKPCSHEGHSSRLCREDCYRLVSACVRWEEARAVHGDVTAASLCAALTNDSPDAPCVSLDTFLAPSSEEAPTSLAARVTSPCAGSPCGAGRLCVVNAACAGGGSCARYLCLPGCPVGEASEFLVPVGALVRVPMAAGGVGGGGEGWGAGRKGCMKICACGARGVLERCQPLPCFSYDNCTLGDKVILHGDTYYMECNECKCYAGERVCSRRACAADGGGAALLTRLPCNCPAHYLPVCVAGRTLASACLAKCSGYNDADVAEGACSLHASCQQASCPPHSVCVPRPTVCLSLLQRPCPQHVCVPLGEECDVGEAGGPAPGPVCDTERRTHASVCELVARRRTLAYYGECHAHCRQKEEGAVCGADGRTYESECAARGALAGVDYAGACAAVGAVEAAGAGGGARARCSLERVVCGRLARARCAAFVPPGACCPRCGGALRVLYSRKQVDRALYGARDSAAVLNVRAVLTALARQVTVAECSLRGHLTVEGELFVSLESAAREPRELQLRLCVLEAERLASLVNAESARLAADLALSALTLALPAHELYDSSAASLPGAAAASTLLAPAAAVAVLLLCAR